MSLDASKADLGEMVGYEDDDQLHALLQRSLLGAELVSQLLTSPFSKKNETDADTAGLEYLDETPYDKKQAIEVMHRMAMEIPETQKFNFTHPQSSLRYEKLRDQVAA